MFNVAIDEKSELEKCSLRKRTKKRYSKLLIILWFHFLHVCSHCFMHIICSFFFVLLAFGNEATDHLYHNWPNVASVWLTWRRKAAQELVKLTENVFVVQQTFKVKRREQNKIKSEKQKHKVFLFPRMNERKEKNEREWEKIHHQI